MPTKAKRKNVKKLNLPKVEVLEDVETQKIIQKAVDNKEDVVVVDSKTDPKVVKSAVQIKAEKEEAERVNPIPVNKVAEAIEISVILVPLGTNHRQIRLAFDVMTNKIQPKDIPDVVQSVLKRAAPMIGERLVEAINVENSLLNATRQK